MTQVLDVKPAVADKPAAGIYWIKLAHRLQTTSREEKTQWEVLDWTVGKFDGHNSISWIGTDETSRWDDYWNFVTEVGPRILNPDEQRDKELKEQSKITDIMMSETTQRYIDEEDEYD